MNSGPSSAGRWHIGPIKSDVNDKAAQMAFRYSIKLRGAGYGPPDQPDETEIETKRALPESVSPATRKMIIQEIRKDIVDRKDLDFEGWPVFLGEEPDCE